VISFPTVPAELLPKCPRCGEPIRSFWVRLGSSFQRAEPCGHHLNQDDALTALAHADQMLSQSRVAAPATPAASPPGPRPG
jgi:hypothetical protein